MLRLVKICLSLACLGVFVFGAFTVHLGERTLAGHLAAIGRSRESRQLVEGTKEKVGELRGRITGSEKLKVVREPEHASPRTAPPAERLSEGDRREMRRLIAGHPKP